MHDVEACARVVHEALRAFARSRDAAALPSWERSEEWMRQATIEGVRHRILNPDAPPSAMHDEWLKSRRAAGWRYGEILNPIEKTHPLLMDYYELPETERRKDELVIAIVRALTKPLD